MLDSKPPVVCICVPTYNVEMTVRETMLSILKQTYPNLVVHISDNASTDDTLKIIEGLGAPNVLIHRHDENVGGEGNFDRCIQLAEGKYTAIFHADDIYEPEMVAKQVAYLESHQSVGAVFTEASLIDEHGEILGEIGKVPQSFRAVPQFDFCGLLKALLANHNFLVCPSVMVRTDIYRNSIKQWGNVIYKSSSDIDVWLRLAKVAPIAVIGERLMRYRLSSAQFSEKIRNRTERTDFFLVMDEYLSKPEVAKMVSKSDIRRYGWLMRHEVVACSLNLCVAGRNNEAKELLKGFISLDSIHAAMTSRRGLVTFMAGVFMRALMLVDWIVDSPSVAKTIKRISWK